MKIHKFAVILLILLSLNSFALIENNDSIDYVFLGCNTCSGFTACRNCPFFAYFGCAYPYCSDSTNTWSTHRSFDFNNTYYSGCLITLKNNGIYDGCNSYAQAGVTFYLFDQNNNLITNISQGNTYSWDCDSYVQDNSISFYVSIYSDMSTACNPSAYNVVNSYTPDINISYLSLPSELVCPDYYSDVYRYTPDAEKGQRLVLYDDCNISEYCDTEDPSCKPISADLGYSLSVEDSDPQARVFKQPGDYVTVVFHSNQSQTVEYSTIGLDSESETCVDGQADLSVGETRCKFSIPGDATSALLTSGTKLVNIHLTTNPDTIYVTDRNALKQRYTDDPNGVQQVLTQLYSKADQREAVVYYLDDYLTGRPWGSFGNYNITSQNPVFSVNSYTTNAMNFVTHKCRNCKNVVIIGDDYVVPYYRWGYNEIFNDYSFSSEYLGGSSNYYPKSLFTDTGYISTGSVYISDLDEILTRSDNVKILLPTTVSQDLRNDIDNLTNTLTSVYHKTVSELDGTPTGCNDKSLGDSTLVIIGDVPNNQAVTCLPIFGLDNSATDPFASSLMLDRNQWGPAKFAFFASGRKPEKAVNLLNEILSNPKHYARTELPKANRLYLHEVSTPLNASIEPGTVILGFVLGTCEGVGNLEGECIVGDMGLSVTPGVDTVTDVRDIGMYCGVVGYNQITGQKTEVMDGVQCALAGSGTIITVGKDVAAVTGIGYFAGEVADALNEAMEHVLKGVKKVFGKGSDRAIKFLEDSHFFKDNRGMLFLTKKSPTSEPLEAAGEISEESRRMVKVFDEYEPTWNRIFDYFDSEDSEILTAVIKDTDDLEDMAKGTDKAMAYLPYTDPISHVAGGLSPIIDKTKQAECLRNLGKIPRRDYRAIGYNSEEVGEWSAGVISKTGIDTKLKRIAESSNLGNLKGDIFEIETAYKKSDIEVAEIGKGIDVPNHQHTDIDVLYANGDIRECKNIDWNRYFPGSDDYNNLKSDLGQKISTFNAYKDPSAKIVVTFKDDVEPEMYYWLKYEKGVDVEVIP
jgi:hypothetical protein